MRLGLVVASCGLKSLIDSKSPVSATTIVNFFSCSSWLTLVFFSSATAVLIIDSPFCYLGAASCCLGLGPKRTPRSPDRQSKICCERQGSVDLKNKSSTTRALPGAKMQSPKLDL